MDRQHDASSPAHTRKAERQVRRDAFRGLKRLGVGKPSDEELNQALWKVLERIALPLTEVRGLKPSEVRPWVALLTSQMIGALVLQIAGRLDFLQTGAQTLLRMMLAQSLAPMGPKNAKAARKSKPVRE